MSAKQQQDNQHNDYTIRPNFKHKFRPNAVKRCIYEVLAEHLADKQYNSKEAEQWSVEIADAIKFKLKDMELHRYKFLVQVLLAQQKGEGIKMNCKCYWDSDSDSVAEEIFMNNSLICVAVVFGIYYY